MRNCASGMQALDSAITNIRAGKSEPRARRRRRTRCPARRCCSPTRWCCGCRAGTRRRASGQRAALLAEVPPGLPRAGDRPHEGPHRSDGGAAHGSDGGEHRLPLRHHARSRWTSSRRSSHARVLAAQKAGHFDGEVVPLYDKAGQGLRGRRRRARGLDAAEPREAQAVLRPQVRQRHRRQQLAGHRRRRVAGARLGACGREARARRRAGASSTRSGRGSTRRRWGSVPCTRPRRSCSATAWGSTTSTRGRSTRPSRRR